MTPLTPGAYYWAKVNLTNPAGDASWTTSYNIISQDFGKNGGTCPTWTNIGLTIPVQVNAGTTLDEWILIKAPLNGGQGFTCDYEMEDGSGNFFGANSIYWGTSITDTVAVASGSTVACNVWPSKIPLTMVAGQQYDVELTLYNTGNTTLTASGSGTGYDLHSKGDSWGIDHVVLPVDIPGGKLTTIHCTATPPATGTKTIQYAVYNRATSTDVASSTGPAITTSVVSSFGGSDTASFTTQTTPPTSMVGGTYYNVSLVFKNTGSNIWSRDQSYRLGSGATSVGNLDNTTWGPTRFELSDSVPPGSYATFNFVVKAPAYQFPPVTYHFNWRLLNECLADLAYSTNVDCTVTS